MIGTTVNDWSLKAGEEVTVNGETEWLSIYDFHSFCFFILEKLERQPSFGEDEVPKNEEVISGSKLFFFYKIDILTSQFVLFD